MPDFKPFNLFEFFFDGGTVRYTSADVTVVWSSNNYVARDISIGGKNREAKVAPETLELTVSNLDRNIGATVLGEEVQGRTAIIYRSDWVATGSYSNPVKVFEGQFDSVELRDEYDFAKATFRIQNEFAKWNQPVPRNQFSTSCNWVFKSSTPGCQFTGTASLCNRTWERCVELGNQARFRGFRHIGAQEDIEIWWGRLPYKAPGSFP